MNLSRLRLLLPTAGLLFAFLIAHATRVQAEDLPTGKIIEKVECRADSTLSYALYVPSNYDSKKKCPVLFAFDPIARGFVPVERFKDAAETYGYIVAGSNNSKNGPWAPSAKAIMAMFNDVLERFAIDQQRVYATGFSGGARVACRLGYGLRGQIAGVIACGAGFPAETPPSAPVPFAFFGTAGIEDFNYVEMRQLDRTLDALGAAHRVEIFEGGHAWAPAELCTRALEWMELQAMKSALRVRSEPLIDALLKKEVERVRAQEAAGSISLAYAGYVGIADEFKGLRDVAEFEQKAAALKDSKEVRQALKVEKDQTSEERTRSAELYRWRTQLEGRVSAGPPAESEDRTMALADLKRAVADLKKRSDARESTPDRALARRLLNQFMASSYEASMALLDRKDYDRAAANLAVEAEIMPDNWRVLYNLACAYSLKGDKKKAIDALKKSVGKGFSNVSELESDKSLDPIREEAAYKKIIEELKLKK
jgi:tetratricopeptide (TPR) repeat protein